MKPPPSIATSPSNFFCLAFFKMFSSTVCSLINLQTPHTVPMTGININITRLPVYADISCLSNSMAPVLSLSIHSRVPVTVIENDCICSSQVDTNATGTSREDETKDTLVHVEVVHQLLRTDRNIHCCNYRIPSVITSVTCLLSILVVPSSLKYV